MPGKRSWSKNIGIIIKIWLHKCEYVGWRDWTRTKTSNLCFRIIPENVWISKVWYQIYLTLFISNIFDTFDIKLFFLSWYHQFVDFLISTFLISNYSSFCDITICETFGYPYFWYHNLFPICDITFANIKSVISNIKYQKILAFFNSLLTVALIVNCK